MIYTDAFYDVHPINLTKLTFTAINHYFIFFLFQVFLELALCVAFVAGKAIEPKAQTALVDKNKP